MAELIEKKDTLNQGREKLNNAIKDSNKAKEDAIQALAKSLSAEQIAQLAKLASEDTQQQLDNIIIESGTSDAEVIQARDTFPLLKDRLNSTDSQLAETEQQLVVKAQNTFKSSLVNHKKRRPMFVPIDDDGEMEVWTKLRPIATEYNIPITIAVIPDRIENQNRPDKNPMTLEQLKQLQREGFEIVSHTWSHARLTDLTDAQVHLQMLRSRDWLDKHGFDGRTAMVYPYGAVDERVAAITRQYYDSGIRIDSDRGEALYPPLDTYNIHRVFNTYGVEKAKAEIDKAAENNGLVLYGMHAWYDDFSVEETKEVIEYAISKGLDIVTIREALNSFGNLLDIPNPHGNILIDADGETYNLSTTRISANNAYRNDSPIDYLPNKSITYTRISNNHAVSGGFPSDKGGTLITHNIADWYTCKREYVVSPMLNNGRHEKYVQYVNQDWSWGEWIGLEQSAVLEPEWDGSIYYKKNEFDQVTVWGDVHSIEEVTRYSRIATIASDYAPKINTPFIVFDNDTETTRIGTAISNNGNIIFRRPIAEDISQGRRLQFNFTYQL